MVTTELSEVFILVHLKEISTTSPSLVPTAIQSPTKNGLSDIIENPEIKFFTKSCAANATTALPIPRPAIRLDGFMPKTAKIKSPAPMYITYFRILLVKLATVLLPSGKSSFLNFLTIPFLGSTKFTSPFAIMQIIAISSTCLHIVNACAGGFNRYTYSIYSYANKQCF